MMKHPPGKKLPTPRAKLPDPWFRKETAEEILSMIAQGAPDSWACRAAGISPRQYHVWLEKGRAGQDRYAEFVERVDAMRAKRHAAILEKILRSDDWRALAWYLERQDRREFGKDPPQLIVNIPQLPEMIDAIDVEGEVLRRLGPGGLSDPADPPREFDGDGSD